MSEEEHKKSEIIEMEMGEDGVYKIISTERDSANYGPDSRLRTKDTRGGLVDLVV